MDWRWGEDIAWAQAPGFLDTVLIFGKRERWKEEG